MAVLRKNRHRTDSQVRRFFRLLSVRSFGSEKSTFEVEHLKKISDDTCSDDDRSYSTSCPQSESSRPRVHFDDNVRVYRARHAPKNRSICWYTQQEVDTYELEAKSAAKVIIQAESQLLNDRSNHVMLKYSLEGVYQLYADGLLDYDAELTHCNGKSAASRIGLDCLVGNDALGTGPSPKFKRLLDRLWELQDVSDPEQRCRLISQASLCASQSSRLGATQLARWWAAQQHSAKSI